MPTLTAAILASLSLSAAAHEPPSPHNAAPPTPPAPEVLEQEAAEEAKSFKDPVRLSIPQLFSRAGEAYFDAYSRWIIFQAVPAAHNDQPVSPHYLMYVARLGKGRDGHVKGIDPPILLSASGSANTCGFFHPTSTYNVIFGSTINPLPAPEPKGAGQSGGGAGYKRDSGSYVWEFPAQMEVCSKTVPEVFADLLPGIDNADIANAGKAPPFPLWNRDGYDAECAFSSDGKNIVYTRVDPETNDPDIYVYNIEFKTHTPVITRKGYDGGPFFSPDNNHICYRSDVNNDNNLQVFVAQLEWDSSGALKRVVAEKQVTDNTHVNWAPFWHPSGQYLLYTTSEVGHDNYEIFSIEAPVGPNAQKSPSELKRRRITYSRGFDGLPTISKDGRYLMWTSQRPAGAKETALKPGQEGFGTKTSSQVWIADVVNLAP